MDQLNENPISFDEGTHQGSDAFIDSQLAVLRTALSHPDPNIRAAALNALRDSVHNVQRIEEETRRKLGTQRLDLLIHQIACALHVDPQELRSRARRQRINTPRQLAMYLTRQLSTASFQAIGTAFNKHHSTVIWSHQQIEKRMAEPGFRGMVERIRREALAQPSPVNVEVRAA